MADLKRGDKVDFWIEVPEIILDGTVEGVRKPKDQEKEETMVSVVREGWFHPIPVPLSHCTRREQQ